VLKIINAKIFVKLNHSCGIIIKNKIANVITEILIVTELDNIMLLYLAAAICAPATEFTLYSGVLAPPQPEFLQKTSFNIFK
jgi:hypothetical protein